MFKVIERYVPDLCIRYAEDTCKCAHIACYATVCLYPGIADWVNVCYRLEEQPGELLELAEFLKNGLAYPETKHVRNQDK